MRRRRIPVEPDPRAEVRDIPLSSLPLRRELFRRVGDSEHMLEVFRSVLPALSDAEIVVTRCSAKPSKSRKSIRGGRLDVSYRVWIEADGEPRREYALLGVAPAPPELRNSRLEERCRALQGHPWVAPFREVAVYVEELQLALLFFPLDPALPGLAEVTGSDGPRVLSAALGRGATELAALECQLVHYKPLDRAVLKIRGERNGGGGRTVYAKFFADDHGASCYRELSALWAATRRSTCLRMPEPIGYDAQRRMLVMAEAPGQRDLTEWIKCLEQGRPLPAGVDLERLRRCALVAARALGELQRSGIRPELRRTFRYELARVKKDRDLLIDGLRASEPELAARADDLLARLEAQAPGRERLVPAHGGYRHKQMIGDELTLTLIDWDGISMANPALDAATFLGRLRREHLRRPGSAPELEEMATTFRREFLEQVPGRERDLHLYEALVQTEQVLRALRRPGDREETAREIRRLSAAASWSLKRVEARS